MGTIPRYLQTKYSRPMSLVVIASTNKVKIAAATQGFKTLFPDIEFTFEGLDSPSGVADQPMTSEETLTGATNRALHAKKTRPEANYWVGIEGGLMTDELGRLMAISWIMVIDRTGFQSQALTGSFLLPKVMAAAIHQGLSMGAAGDLVHGTENIGQNQGTIGILTHGTIDRTQYYVQGVVLALMPFKNPELYL